MRPWHALAPLAVLLAACTQANGGPSVSVEPPLSAADEPVHIEVSGLEPCEIATLSLRSVDAEGARWASAARFRADGDGRIDLDRARPLSGDYGQTGAYGMGLIWSLAVGGRSYGYAWAGPGSRTRRFRPRPFAFDLSVGVRGETVATTTFERKATRAAFGWQDLSLRTHGFAGVLSWPLGGARRPAILLVGGVDGGVPGGPIPALLAGRRYAVLALAYWGERGLPQNPANIRLEYFVRALEWLRRQPQVDPARVVTLGYGKGSEAALLLGVHYPELVHGVVGVNPHNAVRCLDRGCSHGPPWLLRGGPLPYTGEPTNPKPIDDPAAVIPVERIQGPVFLVCGSRAGAASCSLPAARAIARRLEARGDRYAHVLHAYPRASEGVGLLLPYFWHGIFRNRVEDESDEKARADVWPRLLEFLASFEGR